MSKSWVSGGRVGRNDAPETSLRQNAIGEIVPGVLGAWVVPSLATGPRPASELQYRAMAEAGFRSILSVDGRPCDVQAAEQAGLVVGHVPVGYDAIDAQERARLSRAWADLPRPLFIHCHHGQIRGPAVASLLALWDGEPVDVVTNTLKKCQFDSCYAQLRDSLHPERPAPSTQPIRSSSDVPPLNLAMIQLETALETLEQSDRQTPEQTTLMREALAEVDRAVEDAARWSPELWTATRRAWNTKPHNFNAIRQSCRSCHEVVRP